MSTIDRRGATVSAADPPITTNPNPDLAIKAPARVATTGSNITLSGLLTIDGVTVIASDRVLVKDQTDATTNGLYNPATGPWTRTVDANNNSQWAKGTQVVVTDGTVNAGSIWECTATSPITLGTTALTFASLGLPAVPATRNINTTAPLSGGGNLGADRTLSLTTDGTLAVVASALQVAAGGVSLAKMANLAANSIIGNNTGSPATPVALTQAQATALLNLFTSSLQGLVPGSGGGTTNFLRADGTWAAPSVGATANVYESGMRLTLVTATPVMTTTQSAKTTIFLTPYKSQFVPIYDGTNMTPTDVGGELSQATTDATKSPAAVAASSVYDLFVWNDTGTFRCTRGPAWTNDTTRSAGTALTLVKGVWLNNATITNGPAASRGTYVGTVRSNGSSQIDYIFGAGSSSGTAAFFGVWNMYNRVNVSTAVSSTVATWTYALATIRPANNSTTMRVTAVFGLSEDGMSASYQVYGTATAGTAGNDGASIGLGLDSTTTYIVGSSVGLQDQGLASSLIGSWSGLPGLGVHFIQALENSQASLTETFRGGTTVNQNALAVNLRM